jgi:hypothetical protein
MYAVASRWIVFFVTGTSLSALFNIQQIEILGGTALLNRLLKLASFVYRGKKISNANCLSNK